MRQPLVMFGAFAMLSLGLLVTPCRSQDTPVLADELRAARLELTEANGAFAGAGWDSVLRDGANAQFFVVGEQHGGGEIIDFERALHSALAQRGYTHTAMEIGPHSMARIEGLLRSGLDVFEGYLESHRGVFPFIGLREEVRLAEQYIRLSPPQTAIWGLDQEFVGSAPILVELLEARQRTPEQRAAVERLKAAAAVNWALVRDMRQAGLAPLIEAFRDDPAALEILEDYRLSSEIYEPFTIQGSNRYFANLTRETYMKRNFATAFAAAERRDGRAPKVFLKIGASHAMRGFSSTFVPALGNFLAEWGVPRGFSMVNVMVDCVPGPAATPCQPYFGSDHAIYAAASTEKYTLIDLRPIRARLRAFATIDAKSRDLIQGFDFYVLIRDVRPAARTLPPRPTNPAPASSGIATQS